MKTFSFKKVLLTIALVLFAGCGVAQSVYVSGSYDTGKKDDDGYDITAPCYWKDGVRVELDGTEASGIAVSNGSVYVVGTYTGGACYWKDGVRVELDGTQATGIAVSNGSVYITGSANNGACYWKDGVRVDLKSGISANGITIYAGSVYIAGSYEDDYMQSACYWKDGQMIKLPKQDMSAMASNIAVDKNSIYVIGSAWIEGSVNCSWKNGKESELTGSDITLVNGSLYLCDYSMGGFMSPANSPYFTKNGKKTVLVTDKSYDDDLFGHIENIGAANAIFVSGNSVYVAGVAGDSACYWKDGERIELNGTSASDICAVSTKTNKIGDKGSASNIVSLVKYTKTLDKNSSFSVDLDGIQGNTALEKAVNQAVYEGESPKEYADKLFSKFKDTYNEYGGNIYQSIAVKGKQVAGFIQFKKSEGVDLGGAHPGGSTNYYIFDIAQAKQLLLSDFVDFNDELRIILEAGICTYYGAPIGTTLDEVCASKYPHLQKASENFYLTEEGMGFIWNDYEISPYAYHGADIVVPYEQLRLKRAITSVSKNASPKQDATKQPTTQIRKIGTQQAVNQSVSTSSTQSGNIMQVTLDTKKLMYLPEDGKYETLDLRKEVKPKAERLAELERGDTVSIIENGAYATIDGISSNWVYVEVLSGNAKGMKGWCFKGYLDPK